MVLLLVPALSAPALSGPVADPAAFTQCMQICQQVIHLACRFGADYECRQSTGGPPAEDPACYPQQVLACGELAASCRQGCLSIKYPPEPEAQRAPGSRRVETETARP